MAYCIALTTASSEAEANTLASALIEHKLAACVSIYPIKSVYAWKGEVQREQEWQLVIKTSAKQFEAVSEKVKALHSYEVPELIAIRIEQGSPEYLSWLSAQLS